MNRLIAAFVLMLTLAGPASSQNSVRVGLLGPDEEPRFSQIADGLKQGLLEQGYASARIEIVEMRAPRGDDGTALRTLEKLAGQRLAVLFAIGSNLARRARQLSASLPIVFITPGDPVAAGLVQSLARPGSNMTALTFEYPELSAKRLELLRDLAPELRRVLVLYDPRDSSPRQGAQAARAAADILGLTLVEVVQVRDRKDIDEGLKKLDHVDAVLGIPGGVTTGHYEAMIAAANARRRPTILFAHSPSTQEALLSYGASDTEVARQAARAVVKVLEGTNAGDLPVERPAKLTLVVNLRTARALGLTIPPSVMLRADHIIE